MPETVSVRKVNGLPRASFSRNLAVQALPLAMCLAPPPALRDFHPVEFAHAERTRSTEERSAALPNPDSADLFRRGDTPAKSAQTQGTAAGLKQASAKPHYVMVFDQNKCVGCGECKEACAETNKTPAGVFRLALERQNGREPGTACPYCGKIEPCDCERKYVRVSCQQCLDAPCVRVCPTQAAHRDPETNIVTMDPDKCVGCKYCIAACPYNVRFINPQTRVAENCDFCLHTKLAKGEDPACVSKCRYGALAFGDLNDPNSYVAKLLDVKDAVRVRPYLGTEPSLRYIPVMKEKI